MGGAIGEFGMGPGCAFWLMRQAHGWQGKSVAIWHSDCAQNTFKARVPAQGPYPMLRQELRTVLKRIGDRQFPAPEPGRAWLGCCGPMEEQDSGHSASLSGHDPTLRPGFIKGEALSRLSFFSALRWLLFIASPLLVIGV